MSRPAASFLGGQECPPPPELATFCPGESGHSCPLGAHGYWNDLDNEAQRWKAAAECASDVTVLRTLSADAARAGIVSVTTNVGTPSTSVTAMEP